MDLRTLVAVNPLSDGGRGPPISRSSARTPHLAYPAARIAGRHLWEKTAICLVSGRTSPRGGTSLGVRIRIHRILPYDHLVFGVDVRPNRVIPAVLMQILPAERSTADRTWSAASYVCVLKFHGSLAKKSGPQGRGRRSAPSEERRIPMRQHPSPRIAGHTGGTHPQTWRTRRRHPGLGSQSRSGAVGDPPYAPAAMPDKGEARPAGWESFPAYSIRCIIGPWASEII